MQGFVITVVPKGGGDVAVIKAGGWFGAAGQVTDLLPNLTDRPDIEVPASRIEITWEDYD